MTNLSDNLAFDQHLGSVSNIAFRPRFVNARHLRALHQSAGLDADMLLGTALSGAAYDVFGEYANTDSVTYLIFDWSPAPMTTVTIQGKTYRVPALIDVVTSESADYSNAAGESIQSFQTSLSSTTEIEGSYNFFSGSLSVEFSSEELTYSESEFSRIQQTIHLYSLRLDTNAASLRQYLTPAFLQSIDSIDGENAAIEFFNHYGSHFLNSLIMGGRAISSSTTNKTTVNRTYGLDVTAAASYKALTGQLSASEEAKYKESISSFNSNSVTNRFVQGGDGILAISAFDSKEDFSKWRDSVRENPDFVDFVPSIGLAGLWELAKDSATKAVMQAAFEKWATTRSMALQLYANYVDALTVISGGASTIQPPEGYTKVPFDLNRGAGGDYIYLCYHKASFKPMIKNQPGISDLAVIFGENAQPPAGYEKLPNDLNKGAGGEYVYLCFKKCEYNNAEVIKDVRVIGGSSPDVAPDYLFTKVNGDLNKGAGGDYIYFTYSKVA